MIDFKEFNKVSQLSHFAWGMLATILGAIIFHHAWIGAIIIMGWATYREAYYDRKYETPEVRGSDLEDWLVYAAGTVAALVICGIFL